MGRVMEADELGQQIIKIFETDRRTPMEEQVRESALAALHQIRALTAALDFDPTLPERLAQLESYNSAFSDAGALLVRATHHRVRGEEREANRIDGRLETYFVQGGSMWIWELQRWWMYGEIYGILGDVLGLKRCIVRLRAMQEQDYPVGHFVGFALGDYHRSRGELDKARSFFEQTNRKVNEKAGLIRRHGLLGLAETCLLMDDVDSAHGALREAAQAVEAHQVERYGRTYEIYLRSLVAARRGQPELAVTRLAAAIEELESLAVPGPCGLLHEARARVALVMKDHEAFAKHCEAMNNWVRPTKNPALIARAERLRRASARPAVIKPTRLPSGGASVTKATVPLSPVAGMPAPLSPVDVDGTQLLASCVGAADRASRALEVLVQSAGARRGLLYLAAGDDQLRLAAPITGDEPSTSLNQRVEEIFAAVRNSPNPDGRAATAEPGMCVLWATANDGPAPIGIVVLMDGGIPDRTIASRVAREMNEAGDVDLGEQTR